MSAVKTIADILKEHSFFQELSPEELTFIAGCGKNVRFKEGQIIANPGDAASEFYLIREGRVSFLMETQPNQSFIYQTVGPNEILGLEWLIPPYKWTATVQAKSFTRAIAFDGACLRQKCENDTNLGYKLMKHLVQIMVRREDAVRLQLLDVYGNKK